MWEQELELKHGEAEATSVFLLWGEELERKHGEAEATSIFLFWKQELERKHEMAKAFSLGGKKTSHIYPAAFSEWWIHTNMNSK